MTRPLLSVVTPCQTPSGLSLNQLSLFSQLATVHGMVKRDQYVPVGLCWDQPAQLVIIKGQLGQVGEIA